MKDWSSNWGKFASVGGTIRFDATRPPQLVVIAEAEDLRVEVTSIPRTQIDVVAALDKAVNDWAERMAQ